MKITISCLAVLAFSFLAGCGDEVGNHKAASPSSTAELIRGEPITVEENEVDHWAVITSEIGELNASVYRSLTFGFNAVLGARGSKIQLVLNSFLHVDSSPGNLSWEQYETVRDSRGVSEAYPIAVGDNYRGYRLVGSLSEMFEKHEWQEGKKYDVLSGGRLFEDDAKEALVGAFVASKLGLKVGDKFHPYHGLTFMEEAKHKDLYVVVGILEATGTPSDKVIWIPINGIQLMDGHNPKTATDVSTVLLNLKGSAGFMLDMKYNKQGNVATLAWPVENVMEGFFQRGLLGYLKLARQFGEGNFLADLDQVWPSIRTLDEADLNASIVEGEITSAGEKVSVVEGEIASAGTPDDPFVGPKQKEIVELPFPPGSDANASIVLEPVVSNLPPLPKGSGYAPLSFASMSKFAYEVDWEKDGIKFDLSAFARRVPITVRQMDGLAAAVEGFMIPTVVNEDNKVTEFLLLPDQMSCCFGKAPEANGWVVVTAPKGVEIMMDRIIRVTGTMAVEEKWDEEFFVGLYHMTCDKITGPAL